MGRNLFLFFCDKTNENILQIYRQITRTCIKVQQEPINYIIPSLSWWNCHRCRVLCTRQGMLIPSDTWCHHWLISAVPVTNIQRESCGGGWLLYSWLCLLLLDVSIGCVSHSFQNVSFFNHSFWPCSYRFLTLHCLWEISFSDQMINGTVSWLLGLGSSSDHMIILVELSVGYWA